MIHPAGESCLHCICHTSSPKAFGTMAFLIPRGTTCPDKEQYKFFHTCRLDSEQTDTTRWMDKNELKECPFAAALGDGRRRRRKKEELTGLAPVFALSWAFCLYTSQLTVRPFHLNLERHHPTDTSQSWSHLIISTNTTAGRSIAKGSIFQTYVCFSKDAEVLPVLSLWIKKKKKVSAETKLKLLKTLPALIDMVLKYSCFLFRINRETYFM